MLALVLLRLALALVIVGDRLPELGVVVALDCDLGRVEGLAANFGNEEVFFREPPFPDPAARFLRRRRKEFL